MTRRSGAVALPAQATASPPDGSPSLQPARRLLRRVDGVGHVLLGPVALLLADPLAGLADVPVAALVPFLWAFTTYGGVVLLMSLSERLAWPTVVVGLAANVAFVGSVAVSLVVLEPTGWGLALHALVMASGAGVVSALLRPVVAQLRRRG